MLPTMKTGDILLAERLSLWLNVRPLQVGDVVISGSPESAGRFVAKRVVAMVRAARDAHIRA